MTLPVSLGPNPIWVSSYRDVPDNLAKLLVNGRLYTYRDVARSELKATYQDPAGTIPWTNYIQLDSSGSIPGPVYFLLDEPYYLVWKDPTGTQKVHEVESYVPTSGAVPPPVTTNQDFLNYIYNSDFRFFYKQKYENGNILNTQLNRIAPRWLFERSNATGTYELEFKQFTIGQTAILEGNPRYYLNFACSTAGSGQTVLTAKYYLTDVEQFQNLPISFGLQAKKTGSAATIDVALTQHFGTGGTPSADVPTVILNQALTDTWTKYTIINQTLPAIAGKTLGTNDDSLLILEIRYPLSSTCNVDIDNIQLNEGTKLPPYEYETTELKIANKNSLDFNNYSPDFNVDRDFVYTRTEVAPGGSPYSTGGAMFSLQSPVPIGSWIPFGGLKTKIPIGWLPCEGNHVEKWKYRRLYTAIEDIYGWEGLSATISTATVTTTVRGNGNVTDATDVDTGLTITVTQQGTPSLPEKTDIICKAASLIPNGSSFLIHSIDAPNMTVWFDIDFTGVQPSITGAEIRINISSTDTADEVAVKLHDALHVTFFAVPDPRGLSLRFVDDGAGRDPDVLTRTPSPGGYTGNNPGTTQADEFKSHIHSLSTNKQLNSADGAETRIDPYGALATTPVTLNTNTTGGAETRTKNIYAYAIIKY